MAKCYNCGNSFDYDKYYGICPKCSAYNREKLPEEEHQELHEEYDQKKECSNLNGQEYHGMTEMSSAREYQNTEETSHTREYQNTEGTSHAQEYQSMEGTLHGRERQNTSGTASATNQNTYGYVPLTEKQNTYGYVPLTETRQNTSSATIVVFIFLILGLVAVVAMPIIYLVGKSMQLGVRVVKDAAEVASDWNGDNWYEDDWASLDDYEDEYPLPEVNQPRQSVETITTGIQNSCTFGSDQAMTVTVMDQAYVKIPARQVLGFPDKEKLVAIPVSYFDSIEYTDYNRLGVIYVGYGDQVFKEILSTYELGDYVQELELEEVVDVYAMVGESGQGELMVFVPEEVTELSLYLESRDEDTNQMLGLYEIPLEIQGESPKESDSGEAE